jgi:hypothetical protein
MTQGSDVAQISCDSHPQQNRVPLAMEANNINYHSDTSHEPLFLFFGSSLRRLPRFLLP